MTRLRKAVVIGVLVGILGLVLRLMDAGSRLEADLGLRSLFLIRGPVPAPRDVVVVSIDRSSAEQAGFDTRDWPLPRHVHARVVRALAAHDVSVVVMDILFDAHRDPAGDRDLAEALAASGRVVLAQSVNRITVQGANVEINQLTGPIGELQRHAAAVAPFPLPDDSLVHVFWPFFRLSGREIATLPAAALQIHALPAMPHLAAVFDEAGLPGGDEIRRDVSSPPDVQRLMDFLRGMLHDDAGGANRVLASLDARERAASTGDAQLLARLVDLCAGADERYLNFYGPPGTIETIPFHTLLDGGVPFDLAGKVVFVGEGASTGVTSAQQADTYRTAYSTDSGVDLSGVEIGATAFANLLHGHSLRPVGPVATLALVLALGIVAGILARLLPGAFAVAGVAALGAAYGGVAFGLFATRSLVLPVTIPLLVQLPLTLLAGLAARYRDIRKQVPVEIDPYAGQRVFQGVCLTTDVRGYTTLAERITPADLSVLLDEYYDMIRRLVQRRGGIVWGRGGDSALCVWRGRSTRPPFRRSIRRDEPDQTIRLEACLAALDLREAIDRFNARHPDTHQLQTRIGLDAGEIGLGPVGGELQAVGPPASVASRIQALNKPLSTSVLASAAVVKGLDGLVTRPVGPFDLPGVSGRVSVVEILGRDGVVGERELRLCREFAAALDLWERGRRQEATALFEQLSRSHPADGPTAYYRRLCELHSASPASPAD